MFVIPKEEYEAMRKKADETGRTMKDTVGGDLNGHQVNNIEVGDGGVIVIRGEDEKKSKGMTKSLVKRGGNLSPERKQLVDRGVGVSPSVSEVAINASVPMQDEEIQAVPNLASSHIQTDTPDVKSAGLQTDVRDVRHTGLQTDDADMRSKASQTTSKSEAPDKNEQNNISRVEEVRNGNLDHRETEGEAMESEDNFPPSGKRDSGNEFISKRLAQLRGRYGAWKAPPKGAAIERIKGRILKERKEEESTIASKKAVGSNQGRVTTKRTLNSSQNSGPRAKRGNYELYCSKRKREEDECEEQMLAPKNKKVNLGRALYPSTKRKRMENDNEDLVGETTNSRKKVKVSYQTW